MSGDEENEKESTSFRIVSGDDDWDDYEDGKI